MCSVQWDECIKGNEAVTEFWEGEIESETASGINRTIRVYLCLYEKEAAKEVNIKKIIQYKINK